jgi:hypothetical protein
MKNRDNLPEEFKLKMNLMVQNLLLTSLGMCKFAMMHESHHMSQAIKQFKLFDEKELDLFIEKIKDAKLGQNLMLSMADEVMIYTAMDITCKAYLTDLGDEMEQVNSSRLKNVNSSFSEIRNTVIKGCQFVMEGMKETLSGHPVFDDRVDILENYILV